MVDTTPLPLALPRDNESSYLESYLATDAWSPVPDAEENVAAMFSGVISSCSVCSVRG